MLRLNEIKLSKQPIEIYAEQVIEVDLDEFGNATATIKITREQLEEILTLKRWTH